LIRARNRFGQLVRLAPLGPFPEVKINKFPVFGAEVFIADPHRFKWGTGRVCGLPVPRD
jgi:hypothetical protein